MGTFETTTTTMASAMTSTSAFTPTTAGLRARRANKTFSRSTVRVQARKPLVGYEAPDFSAEAVFDQEFQDIKLSDYRGKYVVLFFYPSISPLCARRKSPRSLIDTIVRQAQHRSSRLQRRLQVFPLGVVANGPQRRRSRRLGVPLVSDLKREITEAYDV